MGTWSGRGPQEEVPHGGLQAHWTQRRGAASGTGPESSLRSLPHGRHCHCGWGQPQALHPCLAEHEGWRPDQDIGQGDAHGRYGYNLI